MRSSLTSHRIGHPQLTTPSDRPVGSPVLPRTAPRFPGSSSCATLVRHVLLKRIQALFDCHLVRPSDQRVGSGERTPEGFGDHRSGTIFKEENGYIEIFNGLFRDELFNGQIFTTLQEVKELTAWWRKQYHQVRAHSRPGYRPLAPMVFRSNIVAAS